MLDKVAYTLLNPVSASLVRSPERWPGAARHLELMCSGDMKAERPAVWFKDNAPESINLALSVPPCFSDKRSYFRALAALLANRVSQLRTEFRRQGRG